MLETRLLGEFDVRVDGQPVEIPSRPAQSLLAYLVLNPDTKHRREKLAGLLWPDSEEANARSNLRHALWRLRKAIGDEFFVADKVTISFRAFDDCDIDVYCLDDEAVEIGDLDDLISVVSVYGGDLLPGFYESWVVLERERLRSAFEHVIQQLLDLLVEKGSWPEVLEWGERWIALGQTPEPAYRALMTAHSALGDSASLAAVYQRCCDALRGELGVEPSDKTRATYEWLTKGGDPKAVEEAYVVREVSSATAIRMLLKQWRERGVEILELASLAMVHAARTDEPYDPDDARLLVRSALHHEVDVEPWLKRAGSIKVAVAAMDEVLETYPRPRVRMRIVQALKGLKGEEADEALLNIAITDDSSAVCSEAAVAASQRGKHDIVVMRLVEKINVGGDGAAMSAFVSVIDEVGLPEQVGPYPKLPVAVALAQRRWRDRRGLILRQMWRAGIGAGIAGILHGSAAPLYMALSFPNEFQETLSFVGGITAWMLSGALGFLPIGALQGLASGFMVGLADVLWRGRSRKWWRLLFGCLAGLVHSALIIAYTLMRGSGKPPTSPGVYISMYLLYGLFLGGVFSIVIPEVGTTSTVAQYLRRTALGIVAAVLVTIPPYMVAWLDEATGVLPNRIMFAILLPLGIAIALRNTGKGGEGSSKSEE